MKKILALVLSLSMILALAACGSANEGFSVDKVVATYVTSPLNIPSLIEKNEGSFEKVFGEMGLDLFSLF